MRQHISRDILNIITLSSTKDEQDNEVLTETDKDDSIVYQSAVSEGEASQAQVQAGGEYRFYQGCFTQQPGSSVSVVRFTPGAASVSAVVPPPPVAGDRLPPDQGGWVHPLRKSLGQHRG